MEPKTEKIMIVVGVIVILACAGVGLYFLLKKKKKKCIKGCPPSDDPAAISAGCKCKCLYKGATDWLAGPVCGSDGNLTQVINGTWTSVGKCSFLDDCAGKNTQTTGCSVWPYGQKNGYNDPGYPPQC